MTRVMLARVKELRRQGMPFEMAVDRVRGEAASAGKPGASISTEPSAMLSTWARGTPPRRHPLLTPEDHARVSHSLQQTFLDRIQGRRPKPR
jgi:hypothetical protein